jgi:hypothetical protein
MYKFAIVLTARYPSEKAYAVTTRETANAANMAGYQTSIFAPSDIPERDLIKVSSRTIDILSISTKKSSIINSKIFFTLRRIAIAKEFRRINRDEAYSRIVWTRDPIVALFVPKKQNLVLELHQKPSKMDAQFCKALNFRRNLVVCTLTKSHCDAIQQLFSRHRIAVTPMAVNQKFFLGDKKPFIQKEIAFLGKGWSSGHDNNLSKVIHEIALYNKDFNEDLNITFLGLEEEYQAKLQREIQHLDLRRGKIKFKAHVRHDQVPSLLRNISVGLIPYEKTEYNNQRFPIKALEYAAARVTILATDIPINKEIMSSEFCYFYSPNVSGDLCRALREIFVDPQVRLMKIKKAEEWASSHTYLNRINVVLNSLCREIR